MEQEIDRQIISVSAVVQTLYWSVVLKRELSQKKRLSVYRKIFVPTLTYGHEFWVLTERMRLRTQTTEMSFLHRVAGLSLGNKMRSSVIWERLRVEFLLLSHQEPVEMDQTSGQDTSWTPPWRGVFGHIQLREDHEADPNPHCPLIIYLVECY